MYNEFVTAAATQAYTNTYAHAYTTAATLPTPTATYNVAFLTTNES